MSKTQVDKLSTEKKHLMPFKLFDDCIHSTCIVVLVRYISDRLYVKMWRLLQRVQVWNMCEKSI